MLINGEIDAKKKHAIGLEFGTNAQKRVLFGNYKSIGTGIDQLVVARTMLLFELPLTAADFAAFCRRQGIVIGNAIYLADARAINAWPNLRAKTAVFALHCR